MVAKISKKKRFTQFEKAVYRCVLRIPLGQVRSYEWVAARVGKPKAMRAVGTALRKNPFTLLIPCHRVVKKSGDIGSYAGSSSRGSSRKRKLITLEKTIKDMIK